MIARTDYVDVAVEQTDKGPMIVLRATAETGLTESTTFCLATPNVRDALTLAVRLIDAAHSIDPALTESVFEEVDR